MNRQMRRSIAECTAAKSGQERQSRLGIVDCCKAKQNWERNGRHGEMRSGWVRCLAGVENPGGVETGRTWRSSAGRGVAAMVMKGWAQ